MKILIIAQFVYISAPIYIKSPFHAHIEMISLIESTLIHEETLICIERDNMTKYGQKSPISNMCFVC